MGRGEYNLGALSPKMVPEWRETARKPNKNKKQSKKRFLTNSLLGLTRKGEGSTCPATTLSPTFTQAESGILVTTVVVLVVIIGVILS